MIGRIPGRNKSFTAEYAEGAEIELCKNLKRRMQKAKKSMGLNVNLDDSDLHYRS